MSGLVFPDVRECLNDLLAGTTHVENVITIAWHEQADAHGYMQGPFPLVIIYAKGGTEGFIDRVDRVTLECYAQGTLAVNTLESVKAYITGDSITTAHGYLDNIRVDQVPEDVPYQSDTLNHARASFLVTSRPL